MPLAADSDTSIERWLAFTMYCLKRKQELLELYRSTGGCLKACHFVVKQFCKAETYGMAWKFVRLINARHDAFKCAFGPIVKLMEEQIYYDLETGSGLPQFIKHVPVPDRPAYISKLLDIPGSVYVATDYTSFESHFSRQIMEDVEFVLYDYMTKDLPEHNEFMGLCRNVIAGRNKCQSKTYSIELDATRMSGEMTTSLGNGFTNLVLMMVACDLMGSTCDGVVEGDDGLFIINGPVPTPEVFANLGMNIKLDVHHDFSSASFCGMVFDRFDRINVTDPRDILLNFGWASKFYTRCSQKRLDELLRAKSYSFAYMYRSCPIAQSLAAYGLRITKNVDIRRLLLKSRGTFSNEWEKKRLIEAMRPNAKLGKMEIPINTRMLVQEKFGIAVDDQILLENWLDGLNTSQELHHPILDSIDWGVAAAYDQHYTARSFDHVPDFDIPLGLFDDIKEAIKLVGPARYSCDYNFNSTKN